MSSHRSQHRYSTLISHIGNVYKSSEDERTDVLMAGLDAIVRTCKPETPSQWDVVRADSDRLCKVWSVKECQRPLAGVVVCQIMDILNELSNTSPYINSLYYKDKDDVNSTVNTKTVVSLTPEQKQLLASTKMVISEPVVPVVPVVPTPVVPTIPVVNTIRLDIKEIEIEPRVEPSSFIIGTQIVNTSKYLSDHVGEDEGEDTEVDDAVEIETETGPDDEEVAEETEDAEAEEAEETEAGTGTGTKETSTEIPATEPVKTDTKPVEAEAEAEEDEAEAEEAESEDEAEEDEEEMGMVTIRGRKYWLTSVTKKLYEVTADDDIGKEVGVLENGRPKFLAM